MCAPLKKVFALDNDIRPSHEFINFTELQLHLLRYIAVPAFFPGLVYVWG
jgi:hypothetical protein